MDDDFDPEKTKQILKKRRPKNRKTKTVIVFDEAARKEYLTGFHKRKNERRKRAKEEQEKRVKEERQALRKQVREFIRKSDQHRVPELDQLDQLGDSEVFDLPNHTVTITDMSEVNFSGGRLHSPEENSESQKKNADEKPLSAEDLRKKRKQMKHKLAKCGNLPPNPQKKFKKGSHAHSGKLKKKDKCKFSGGKAKHKKGFQKHGRN